MIHMIIADDDRLIRESLTQLIDWGSLGIEIIASTETGTKTLEQVFLLHPDILLTDIEMPGINGIDLLQEIKKHDSHCEVIFLSAYSYFSYAQDAVRYGAFSYLLKPVDEAVLLQTVSTCISHILSNQKNMAILQEGKHMHSIALSNVLKSLLWSSGISPVSQAERHILELAGFPLTTSECAGAVYIHTFKEKAFASCNLLPPTPDALSYPDNFPPLPPLPFLHNFHISLEPSEELLLWCLPSDKEQLLQTALHQYAKQLRQLYLTSGTISVSLVHDSTQLYKLYPECSFAALFPLFQANTIPEFNHAEQLLPAELPSYTAEQLLTTFEQNTDAIDKTIQILFLSFINNGILYDFNEVQLCCISILDSIGGINNPFSCSLMEWESDFMFSFKKELLDCHNIESLYFAMVRILHQLFDKHSTENIPKSRIVCQALQYIRENYISATLSEASELLFISSSYLSRLFASEIKESFSRYLMRYRMAVAKEKMSNPKYKMYEIALSVGYSDLAHFSKAFKTIEGISPGKYREKLHIE